MKSSEIKSFLLANMDLFGPGLGEQAVIDVEDIHELFRRLFESREYKTFVERERWQRVKDVFGTRPDAGTIKGLALGSNQMEW